MTQCRFRYPECQSHDRHLGIDAGRLRNEAAIGDKEVFEASHPSVTVDGASVPMLAGWAGGKQVYGHQVSRPFGQRFVPEFIDLIRACPALMARYAWEYLAGIGRKHGPADEGENLAQSDPVLRGEFETDKRLINTGKRSHRAHPARPYHAIIRAAKTPSLHQFAAIGPVFGKREAKDCGREHRPPDALLRHEFGNGCQRKARLMRINRFIKQCRRSDRRMNAERIANALTQARAAQKRWCMNCSCADKHQSGSYTHVHGLSGWVPGMGNNYCGTSFLNADLVYTRSRKQPHASVYRLREKGHRHGLLGAVRTNKRTPIDAFAATLPPLQLRHFPAERFATQPQNVGGTSERTGGQACIYRCLRALIVLRQFVRRKIFDLVKLAPPIKEVAIGSLGNGAIDFRSSPNAAAFRISNRGAADRGG
ncbi:hypothetical protein LCM4579_24625 [Ensifer sp. LCM 4579]|nr:hypothetical protein LCM4579_24625 [Ensifer sp. LCM 4579]